MRTLTHIFRNNWRMDSMTLQDVYKKAAQNAPTLGTLLQRVAERTRGRAISNFKNPQTAATKAEMKNEDTPSRHYTLNDLNDIARGRLVYSSYDAMKKGVDVFKQQANQVGIKVAKEQNFFTKPEEGYRGYHVDVSFPNGQHSEVQFHTPQSYANALATHDVHETFGKDTPAPIEQKTEKIGDQIMQLPNESANKVAADAEQKALPKQQQNQNEAKAFIEQALNNPNAAIAEPLAQSDHTTKSEQNSSKQQQTLPIKSQPSSINYFPGA